MASYTVYHDYDNILRNTINELNKSDNIMSLKAMGTIQKGSEMLSDSNSIFERISIKYATDSGVLENLDGYMHLRIPHDYVKIDQHNEICSIKRVDSPSTLDLKLYGKVDIPRGANTSKIEYNIYTYPKGWIFLDSFIDETNKRYPVVMQTFIKILVNLATVIYENKDKTVLHTFNKEQVLVNLKTLNVKLVDFNYSCCIKGDEDLKVNGRSCCYDETTQRDIIRDCVALEDRRVLNLSSPSKILLDSELGKDLDPKEIGLINSYYCVAMILRSYCSTELPFSLNAIGPSFRLNLIMNDYADIAAYRDNVLLRYLPVSRCIYPTFNQTINALFTDFIRGLYLPSDRLYDSVMDKLNRILTSIQAGSKYRRISDNILSNFNHNILIQDTISGGSQGTIYVCRTLDENLDIGWIVLKDYDITSDYERKMARMESCIMKNMSQIEPPVTPKYMYSGPINEDGYILGIEYMKEWVTLHKFISEKHNTMTDEDIKTIIKNLFECIKKVHTIGSHKDIKEDNILINPNTLDIKLIDFALGCCKSDPDNPNSGCCHSDTSEIKECVLNMSQFYPYRSPLLLLFSEDESKVNHDLIDIGKHDDIYAMLSVIYYLINYDDYDENNNKMVDLVGIIAVPRFKSLITPDMIEWTVSGKDAYKELLHRSYILSNKDNIVKRPTLDPIIDRMVNVYIDNIERSSSDLISIIEMVLP